MTDDCKTILGFLDCGYELIKNENKTKREEIATRYYELLEQGQAGGFFPLIIVPSDTLAESLEFFLEDNDIENTPESISSFRQNVIEAAKGIDGKTFLAARLDEALEPCDDEDYDIIGQFKQPALQSAPQPALAAFLARYATYEEIIIAKIPAENPWELAVWLPMGGFNDCPLPENQAAVFRYWFEKYGAIPSTVTHDIWEVVLTQPPAAEGEAEALAKEQYAFCPDLVDQGTETIRALASGLIGSYTWFFWWD